MKLIAAAVLLVVAAASPQIQYFRYERPLQSLPQQPAPACLAIDPALFAHASPGLADLRMYRDGSETAYIIQTSAPAQMPARQIIAALNLAERSGQTVFDARMPGGSYSDLELNVTGQNFLATVNVTGSQEQTGAATKIGAYTIFDLTRQRLGRSTILHLPTSDFQYLHFRIDGSIHPESINGLSIERAASSHPNYITVASASSAQLTQKGHSTVIDFTVPANVPVDRVAFDPGSIPANFSREVTVSVAPVASRPANDSVEPPQPFTTSGNVLRVHTVQDNRHIDQERLEIDAPRTALDTPTGWTITIDNGDDVALALTQVRLQMFERDLCLQTSPGSYSLYYGDPALAAPRYDIGQFLVIHPDAVTHLSAGQEQQNSDFRPRPDDRPFTEKHPALLWSALALVIILLGFIALRPAAPPKTDTSA